MNVMASVSAQRSTRNVQRKPALRADAARI